MTCQEIDPSTKQTMDRKLSEGELLDLYAWIDKIPLSRRKSYITRDFSDGVMAAEVVKYFFPKLVDMNNYVPANSTHQKLSNWNVLNRKVLSKLNFHVPEETVKKIVMSTAGAIEPTLVALGDKINEKLRQNREDRRKGRVSLSAGGEGHLKNGRSEYSEQLFQDMNPAVQLLLQEKEQAFVALQETVEILQLKVNRLEQLVHLKDMRIKELNQHLEMYEEKGNRNISVA